MADNSTLPATGDVIATDDIAGVKHQLVKIEWGSADTANQTDVATGKPLPIQVRSSTGLIPIGEPTDAKATATDTTSVSLISVAKQISASAQLSATAAKQPALGTAGTPSTDVITVQGSGSGTALPVSIASVPSHAVTNAGTFAVQAAQSGTWNVTNAGTFAVQATQAGTWNVTNISGTVSLPTGASTETSLAALLATAGATSGAKVITDANGTIQQYLRGIVSQWISSTLTLASRAASAAASFTCGTTAYAANDVAGGALSFTTIGPSGAEVTITSVELEIDTTGVISGETSYRLYLYSVTPPSAIADSSPWDLGSGDRASFLGFVDIGTPVDLGSTLYVRVDNVNAQVKLSGTGVFGYLVSAGAYTPTARVFKVTLHAVN